MTKAGIPIKNKIEESNNPGKIIKYRFHGSEGATYIFIFFLGKWQFIERKRITNFKKGIPLKFGSLNSNFKFNLVNQQTQGPGIIKSP